MVELIARYKAVSSAKSLTLDLTCSGRSFMYARTENRALWDARGDWDFSELIPLITTACFSIIQKVLNPFKSVSSDAIMVKF